MSAARGRPADPLVEAFEAETVEHMFYSDGASWGSTQLFDATRLLTVASYHRIALGEISRTLTPSRTGRSLVEDETASEWTMSELIDFSP